MIWSVLLRVHYGLWLGCALAGLQSVPASAQCPEDIAKLVASDAAQGDVFGNAVSIDGDTAVIAARFEDENGTNAGAAYIFSRDHGGPGNWGEVVKITASDGAENDNFGWSASISGDTVVIGAHRDDDDGTESGSAYIFQRDHGGTNNWGAVAKLTASDAAAQDRFGWSVSVSGDTVIVGAYWHDLSGFDEGAAYVFERDQGGVDTWGQTNRLIASDSDLGDEFGYSVSIDTDRAIVGARGHRSGRVNSGSVFVFERHVGGQNNWGEVAILDSADGDTLDWFGWSVSIREDTAIVGTIHNNGNAADDGAAYIFQRNHGGEGNWGQIAKLIASDGVFGARFGDSVSIWGDTAVVGASQFLSDGPGAAYVYRRNRGGSDNWGQSVKLMGRDPELHDEVGVALSIDDATLIVGALGDDDRGSASGSAFVYHFGDPCDMNCDGEINAFDIEPLLDLLFGPGVPCGPCTGDVNGDGSIDSFDIEPFLECLFGP